MIYMIFINPSYTRHILNLSCTTVMRVMPPCPDEIRRGSPPLACTMHSSGEGCLHSPPLPQPTRAEITISPPPFFHFPSLYWYMYSAWNYHIRSVRLLSVLLVEQNLYDDQMSSTVQGREYEWFLQDPAFPPSCDVGPPPPLPPPPYHP